MLSNFISKLTSLYSSNDNLANLISLLYKLTSGSSFLINSLICLVNSGSFIDLSK